MSNSEVEHRAVVASFATHLLLHHAIANIDGFFGAGYAMKNPRLLEAMLRAGQIEYNRSGDQANQPAKVPA